MDAYENGAAAEHDENGFARGKKRKRKDKEWKQNIRKQQRAEGKEYKSCRGSNIPARKTGIACRCCRGCLDRFSDVAKSRILEFFNHMKCQDTQDSYLLSLITVMAVKRHRPSKPDSTKERTNQYYYKVKIMGSDHDVCRDGFASLHGIGVGRVKRLVKLAAEGLVPKDGRGTHNNRPNAIKEEVRRQVDEHIRSFPRRVCHYGKTGKKKYYLSSALTVRKMYTLFLEKYYSQLPKNKKKVHNAPLSYEYYRRYFVENFNLRFGRPASDTCGICAEYESKISTEKNTPLRQRMVTEKALHKRKAKVFYTKTEEAQNIAQTNDDTDALFFDFKQNVPFPHLSVGEIFYSRQMWMYCFCITSGKTQKSTMYVWPENEGGRGVDSVLTCIMHYINHTLSKDVKKLLLFSDGCRGQNHNHTVVRFLFTLVHTGKFTSIVHRLPIRGHSYLPCDRHFGIIEQVQRKQENVEMYDEWIDLIKEHFEVVQLRHTDFLSCKAYFGNFFKKTCTKQKEAYKVASYKVFSFSNTHKYEVEVSKHVSNNDQSSRFPILRPNQTPSLPDHNQQLLRRPRGIKAAKLADLKKLERFLKPATIAFINGLHTSDGNSESESDYDYE